MSFKEQSDALIKKSIEDSGMFVAHRFEIETLIESGEYFLTSSAINLDMYNEIKESITKLNEAIK